MLIMRLAAANLKKKKSLTATLLFLSVLAVLFLNLGLILNAELKEVYPACAERLKGPDFLAVTSGTKYKTSFETFLLNDDRVSYVEKEEIIYLESTKNSANSLKAGAVIFNKDAERKIEPVHLLKEDKSVPKEKAIYLPRIMENKDVRLGGDITFTFKNIDYSFQVAGFFETTYMGTTGYGFMKYFVPEERFLELYESAGSGKIISAELKDEVPKRESSSLKKDFLRETNYYGEVGGLMVSASCLSYLDIEGSIVSLFSIPMVIMIAIAFIIGVINFIIVYFKVKEEIEESMTNIGSLLAMGYTTGQIMISEVVQFASIGAAAGISGILLTYAALPLTMQYGEGIVGIAVHTGIYPETNLYSALVVLFLMALSAVLAAWKIKKISPVTALRKGVKTHHFGQNFFPLKQGNQSIFLRLALKNTVSNLRQSITTIIVICLGVFSVGLSVVLYSNFGNDNSAVTRMTGMEVADVQIKTLPHVNVSSLQKELDTMDEVRKTNQSESYMATIEEEEVHFIISNDFSKTETLTITEGVFPKYKNEVVLTPVLMQKFHKKIGDTICVTANGAEKEYMISGISMGTNSGGKMGLMSLEGLQRMVPYFTLSEIDVYLKEKKSQKEFMDKVGRIHGIVSESDDAGTQGSEELPGSQNLKYAKAKQRAEKQIAKLLDQYGMNSVEYSVMLDGEIILSGNSNSYQIKEISSLTEYLEGQLESYATMMNGLMFVIFLVMLLIMGTIISITIKSMIRRQKEEFGIYKAMGFTTKDIVKIIRLNFIVNASVGALIGIVFCRLFANKLLQLFFQNLGLELGNFDISLVRLFLVGIVTVLYVWILTTIKAYQVRKITVYELLTE